MQRVDTPSAISIPPSQEPAGTPGYFTKGDPAQSIPATVPGQDWFNSVQEELIAILVHASVTPDKTIQNQIITALISLGLRAATTTESGVAEIATQLEVDAGADNSRIVTPLTFKTALNAAIASLLDSAPGTLDTLNELAAALGDDPNFATTVTTLLSYKAPLSSPAFTGLPTAPTPADGNSSTLIATTAFVLNAIATRNAYSATKLQTSRTLQLTGDVTGSASFNGTANATIAAVIPNNSINQNQMLNASSGTTYAWTQDNAELASPAGTSYLTCDEWRIAVDGTVTIYFQHYCYTANSSTDAYARVRKNGSVIQTYTAFDQNVQTQTLNVSVNHGDVVDIQWASKGGIAGESLIKNRRLYTGNACSVPASKSYTYGQ